MASRAASAAVFTPRPCGTYALTRLSTRSLIVAGEACHPRPLTGGVGDDLVPLEREAEIDNAGDDHEQQRQGQRELHERCAALLPVHGRGSYRSHSTATAPTVMGKAYGSRGPCRTQRQVGVRLHPHDAPEHQQTPDIPQQLRQVSPPEPRRRWRTRRQPVPHTAPSIPPSPDLPRRRARPAASRLPRPCRGAGTTGGRRGSQPPSLQDSRGRQPSHWTRPKTERPRRRLRTSARSESGATEDPSRTRQHPPGARPHPTRLPPASLRVRRLPELWVPLL